MFSGKKHDLKKAVVFGSAFLARALVFSGKHNQLKAVVLRVGVPSSSSTTLKRSGIRVHIRHSFVAHGFQPKESLAGHYQLYLNSGIRFEALLQSNAPMTITQHDPSSNCWHTAHAMASRVCTNDIENPKFETSEYEGG